MDNSPTLRVGPVVESSGFTLIEEDDVGFLLALCREINRIYTMYQDGELTPTENVWAGVNLTLTMLSCLQGTVLAGMPAMRLQVAAAQAREMNAVLFGRQASTNRMNGHKAVADPGMATGQGSSMLPFPSRSGSFDNEAAAAPSGLRPSTVSRLPWRDRGRTFVAGRSTVTRLVLGLMSCVLVAVLIDVPLTVMALFPGLLLPLAACFIGVPLVARLVRRFWPRPDSHRLA
jgi:hypothetical protein